MPINTFPWDAGQMWRTTGLALVYKHSSVCGVSAVAEEQVQALAKVHPELPIWRVDVIAQRGLSEEIAGVLGVQHASPQAILLLDGRPVWSATHYRIMRSDLLDAVERHRSE